MASKTFLVVHLVTSPPSELEAVLTFAKSLGAHVKVVVLGTTMMPAMSLYGVVPDDAWATNNMEVFKGVDQCQADVQALVEKMGVSATIDTVATDASTISATIAKETLCADMTVFMDKNVLDTPTRELCFNGALFETGKPVLLTGNKTINFENMSIAIVAWNKTPQAAKAIHHALNYLKPDTELHIAMIDPHMDDQSDPGNDLVAFLQRKGLKSILDRLSSDGLRVSSVLKKQATKIEADLIVMGGYGHSRLREWVFGGTTRDMLSKIDLPVFMAN